MHKRSERVGNFGVIDLREFPDDARPDTRLECVIVRQRDKSADRRVCAAQLHERLRQSRLQAGVEPRLG